MDYTRMQMHTKRPGFRTTCVYTVQYTDHKCARIKIFLSQLNIFGLKVALKI